MSQYVSTVSRIIFWVFGLSSKIQLGLVSSNSVLLHCFFVIINWYSFLIKGVRIKLNDKKKQIQKQVQKKYREIKQQRKEEGKNSKAEVLIVVAIVVLFIFLNAFFKAL